MVVVHGSHPLADGGAGFGDLSNGGWLEFVVSHVRLDCADDIVRDVVLQRRGEGGVTLIHHSAKRNPSLDAATRLYLIILEETIQKLGGIL